MYLAWPAASFSEDNSSEAKKRLFRQSATMVGDDDDEDYEWVFYNSSISSIKKIQIGIFYLFNDKSRLE